MNRFLRREAGDVERGRHRSRSLARREARRARHRFRRKLLRWGALGVVGFFGLAIILSFFLPAVLRGGPQRTGSLGPPDDYPAVQGTPIPIFSAEHVSERQRVSYTSTPPAGGEHSARTARWDIYDEPILNKRQIHNLEHSGIVIQYNPDKVDADTIERLKEVARSVRYLCILMAPYPDMEQKIALTAWGFMLNLEEVDDAQIYGFIGAHANQGPESCRL